MGTSFYHYYQYEYESAEAGGPAEKKPVSVKEPGSAAAERKP